jgi:hypothetical protein
MSYAEKKKYADLVADERTFLEKLEEEYLELAQIEDKDSEEYKEILE